MELDPPDKSRCAGVPSRPAQQWGRAAMSVTCIKRFSTQRHRREPARSVLDGGEHGATLMMSGAMKTYVD